MTFLVIKDPTSRVYVLVRLLLTSGSSRTAVSSSEVRAMEKFQAVQWMRVSSSRRSVKENWRAYLSSKTEARKVACNSISRAHI